METYSIYFAGELFTHKDLAGNALLAEAIAELSDNRYCSVLPQNFLQDGSPARRIRDQDLLNLLQSDLALFGFDGTDIDSGTLVEFMTAKFGDIPAVILRTDYRSKSGGDHEEFPWNLMANFYPRTEIEVVDARGIYQNIFREFPITDAAAELMIEKRSSDVSRTMVRVIAQAVVDAFDRVRLEPPRLPAEHAETVYSWLAQFAGFERPEAAEQMLKQALERKRQRRLLA